MPVVVQDRTNRSQFGELVRGRVRSVWGDLQVGLYTRGALSASKLSLPDFLGIGAQKSGTTWLYHNLRCHPELFLPERKELHYLDRHLHRGLKWYAQHFEAAGDKVKGEITPSYGSIPLEHIKFVQSVMPRVRIVFLMRNPVERAWSQARMNLITRTKRRIEDVSEQEFFDHFTAERSLKRGDYRSIIENWESIFPRDQLHYGFFEDVAERPKELLSEMFRHIGVSLDVDWASFPYHKVIREGVSKPMPENHRRFLQQLLRPDIEWLAGRFGSRPAEWLHQVSSKTR